MSNISLTETIDRSRDGHAFKKQLYKQLRAKHPSLTTANQHLSIDSLSFMSQSSKNERTFQFEERQQQYLGKLKAQQQ